MTVAKRISPGSVLTVGLSLAVAAFTLWAVQATALDQGSLHRHARDVLSESPVRDAMATRVANGIMINVPGGVAADPSLVATVASRAIEQPEFVAAFAAALDRVQARVVHGTEGPITLDPALVTQAVRAAGATEPQLATPIAATAPIVVGVPDREIPDLARWADLLEAAVRAFAFFAVLLITYALLRIEHRVWALARIGRWAIVLGVSTLGLFWLVPRALVRPLGGWIAVGGAVAGAADVLVPISLVLIAVGGLAVFGAHRWEARDRQQLLSVIPRAPTRSTNGPGPWESPV
jgi:hypothetical protein